jgi:LETM1 and EF-hand domain-containing protein 1
MRQVLRGEVVTRRERRMLLRVAADLFRLVPFLFFVIVPFAEFSLPFFLKVFPNMLPSQFQEKLQAQENIKRQLALRMDLAEFFNDTLATMAKTSESTGEAKELQAILEKVRDGMSAWCTARAEGWGRLFVYGVLECGVI